MLGRTWEPARVNETLCVFPVTECGWSFRFSHKCTCTDVPALCAHLRIFNVGPETVSCTPGVLRSVDVNLSLQAYKGIYPQLQHSRKDFFRLHIIEACRIRARNDPPCRAEVIGVTRERTKNEASR